MSSKQASLLSNAETRQAERDLKDSIAKPCAFRVRVHSVSVADLRSRHRFGEELRAVFRFQQEPGTAKKSKTSKLKKLKSKSKKAPLASGVSEWERVVKTEYKPSHGGDCVWKNQTAFKLKTPHHKVSDVKEWLKEHNVIVHVYCKHDAKQNKKFGGGNGELTLDLFTCATGPARHNMPLKSPDGETLGRIEFALEMQQETVVGCQLSEVKGRKFESVTGKAGDVNAYVKYGYGLTWPSGHVYSRCRERNANPNWIMADFPKLQFKTTIDELMAQCLFLHVTDAHDDLVRGEKHTPLGEMKFIFKLAIESKGDTPIDSGGISFKSPLMRDGQVTTQTLEGILTFDNIPHFAQMKAVNVQRVPVHTEEGILDAVPRFPWLVQPELEIFMTGTTAAAGGRLNLDDSAAQSTSVPASNDPPVRSRQRSMSIGDAGDKMGPRLPSLARAPSNSRMLALAETKDLISFSPKTERKVSRPVEAARPLDMGTSGNAGGPLDDLFAPAPAAAAAANSAAPATTPAPAPLDPVIESKSYNPFL